MDKVKTWLLPLVMIAGAGIGIFFLWPRNVKPPTLQQAGVRPPVPTPAGPLEKADALRVRNRYGEFALKRQADGWHLEAPFDAAANDKLVESLLRRMQTFQFGLVIGSSPEIHEREKVAGKQSVEVEVSQGGRKLWHFHLGKSSEYTLFREEGANDVWQIRGAVRQAFVRDVADWLRPEIVGVREQDVASLAFFRADGSETARFAFEGDSREVKAQLPPGTWHPSRVKRSLARLLNLRVDAVEADASRISLPVLGKVELVFASGRGVRLSIHEASEERVPVRVEERGSGGEWKPLSYVPLVRSHTLRDVLLLDALDLADPLVLKVPESAVQAMRGKCGDFSWDMARDTSGIFVVKSSTREFALARSRLDEFFAFLDSGNLSASDVVAPLQVAAEFMPQADGDFLELDLLPDKGKKTQRVRISWGKPTPVDRGGYRFHYTAVSDRTDRVYKVMDKHIAEICRNREGWMLQPKDPENTPVPGVRQ